MPDKFLNKYRIPSARLQTWDYGANAAYFITICSKHREHFFGEIVDGIMHLNEMGELAEQFWLEIPERFPYIELGNFVVMPNHVHGILIVNKTDLDGDASNIIVTNENSAGGFAGLKNPMLAENISRAMNWYKGRCKFECKKINPDFGWQARFHDHIIRNSKSFAFIQHYIAHNPQNWENDRFYGAT